MTSFLTAFLVFCKFRLWKAFKIDEMEEIVKVKDEKENPTIYEKNNHLVPFSLLKP